MSDLISRQAAIDALRDALIPEADIYFGNELADGFNQGLNRSIKEVEKLPSAEPKIIKCKDCKHYEADIMANPWGVCCHRGWVGGHIGHEVSEDGWCYRAERRKE